MNRMMSKSKLYNEAVLDKLARCISITSLMDEILSNNT